MIKEGERDATLKYLAAAPKNRLAINSYTDGKPLLHLLVPYVSPDTAKQSRHRVRTSADTTTTSSSAQSLSPTLTLTTFVTLVA